MGILSVFLYVIFIIASLFLVFMVIIQDSDSDSLGGVFAGGSGSAFGSRSTNVVIRFTYVLGAVFFVAAFSLAILNKSNLGNVEKAAQGQAQGSTSTDWWNAKPQSAAPDTLKGADGSSVQAPANPVPTPSTGNK
jgi:preprotein translocase subunit SecG